MNRCVSLNLLAFAALVSILLAPSVGRAEDQKAPKVGNIAVLDLEMVIQQSDAGKGIREALKVKEDALQKEADAAKKSLHEKEAKLIKDRKGGMDDKAFEAAKKDFEESIKKSQKTIMDKSAAIEKTRMQALKDIQSEIGKVTADVADERKLEMVVDRKAVVIAERGLDITEEVLNRLNKAVKSIPLK